MSLLRRLKSSSEIEQKWSDKLMLVKQSIEDKYPMVDGKLKLDWQTEVRPRLHADYPDGWNKKKVGDSLVFLI